MLWHKRLEIALQAARARKGRSSIVGGGPDLKRLEARYGGPHVTFTGRIADASSTTSTPARCALVVPNVEEFGIAAVEAQAAGRR